MQSTAIRIDYVWFRTRYGQNFPDLLDDSMTDFLIACIDDVYTMFSGVAEIWNHLQFDLYNSKTQMCYGLLVAWYITDVFPTYAVGVVSSGGIPLKEKRIGGVTIKFSENAQNRIGNKNNADLLGSLKSNSFGAKAYAMIKASGKINLFLR